MLIPSKLTLSKFYIQFDYFVISYRLKGRLNIGIVGKTASTSITTLVDERYIYFKEVTCVTIVIYSKLEMKMFSL